MDMRIVSGFTRGICLNVNSNTLIAVSNASLTLHNDDGHFKALQNINFCLQKHEHVGILGPNGAGKSTFLRLLAGEAWADADAGQNSIIWHYKGINETSPIMARRMCALVSPAQQELYTKYQWQLNGEDILLTAFSGHDLQIPEPQQQNLVYTMAKQLKCLALLKMPVSSLSQGQLRILLLGRALLRKPQVLLLDEYLDGLDAQVRSQLIDILELIAKNTTLIISTHRSQGLLPCIKKKLFIAEGLLKAQATKSMEVKSTNYIVPKQNLATKPIIEVYNATVFIERLPVLEHINWTLQAGEHWMIHGNNGSGKSTFLRLLAGDEYPAVEGNIKRYFKHLYPHEQNCTKLTHIKKAIRLVSDHEQTCYSYNLKGIELVLSGIDNVIGEYRAFMDQEVEEAHSLISHFGLENLETRRISTLSTGQLRRLFIARALMAKPEVLLLDEPFSALDTQSRLACMQSLDELSLGISIVLVSHYNDDQLSCINKHAHMQSGRLNVTKE